MDEKQINTYKEMLIAEIKGFQEKGESFLRKEISVAEFKGISGGMGVYAQKGGESFMLRLRIPSGILTRAHMELIHDFALKYGIEKLHLTTRQAIQLHDLKLNEVCEIMEEAIRKGLYTRGGGGNFPRNVALSPLSGAEPGEAFDVTPFALVTGEYLMEHITEYHLPRKLKIAYSNGGRDNAGCNYTDLGFQAIVKDQKPYFKVYLAGGLGNNPSLGIELEELIQPSQALYYVEAVIRLFMAEGDYQNKGKARLRYVPVRMGREAFLKAFEEKLAQVKSEGELVLPEAVLEPEDSRSQVSGAEKELESLSSCFRQKQQGLYSVNIHSVCGQLSVRDFQILLDFLHSYDALEEQEVRLSGDESFYVTNLNRKQAEELLGLLEHMNMTASLEKSISCIGTPSCQIGMVASQELIHMVLTCFQEKGGDLNRLPELSVSGCLNSCARHQVSSLGFTGIKKRVENEAVDAFELFAGGSGKEGQAVLGKSMGILKKTDIPEFLYWLSLRLEELEMEFDSFLKDREEEFNALVQKYKI